MRAIGLVNVFLLANAACASGGIHQVAFVADAARPESQSSAARTVHVVKNNEMQDTALESRIRIRLEEFLLQRGFIIAPPDTAEIYVLASFGAGERMVASTAAVFRPADIKVERDRDGQVVRRTTNPDRMEYVRVPVMKNSVWLQVISSDARYFRETGQVKNLWRGESSMEGMPSSLAMLAPYLLVPSLKYFGKPTRDVVTMDVGTGKAAWRDP